VAGGEATTREPQQKGAPLGNQANLRGIGPRGARFGGGGGGAVGVVPGWRRWRVWAGEVALEFPGGGRGGERRHGQVEKRPRGGGGRKALLVGSVLVRPCPIFCFSHGTLSILMHCHEIKKIEDNIV
jgi:hypothetical protein